MNSLIEYFTTNYVYLLKDPEVLDYLRQFAKLYERNCKTLILFDS